MIGTAQVVGGGGPAATVVLPGNRVCWEVVMMVEGPATRLSVFVGADDVWHHRPLYTEIVHRAHRAGLAGATVLRGTEGYGASEHIHTSRLLSLAADLPVLIVIVDTEERIRAFLPQLDELVSEGLVTLDPVEVIRYVGRERP